MRSLLFILILFSFNNAFCQYDLNTIKWSGIIVKNTLNKAYLFGSSKDLQRAFGKPKNITKEKSEVLDGIWYTYKYKGFETDFNKQNWEGTTITSPDYTVLFNKVPYKIGEHISKFKRQFPISFAHREHIEKDHNALHIMITNADTYIFIGYNDSGYITEIEIANDNS